MAGGGLSLNLRDMAAFGEMMRCGGKLKGKQIIPAAAVNDTAKPARMIKVGDIVKVRKPPVTYSFRVLALTENRLGAKLVPDYMENITPKSELDLLEVVKISGFIDRRKGLGRPTKREGRELSRFTEEAYTFADSFDWDDDWDDDDDDANGNLDLDFDSTPAE